MNILFAVVLLGFAATVYGQQCISPRGFNPNICLFTPSASFRNDFTDATNTKCTTANSDLFSTAVSNINLLAICNAAIIEDEGDCINAFAKYQCSRFCNICGQKACKSLCTDLIDSCPTAVAAGCFSTFTCATTDSSCTNWNIDSSEIASPPTTTKAATTTKTTTTTKASTNTGTSTTTSSGTSTTSGVGVIQISHATAVALCFITLSYSLIF